MAHPSSGLGGTVAQPPNILLVMTDQQRWDSLGCYGAHWVSTPHLDRLAAQGVRFDNCYANNPICTPARASLMTGLELPAHGVCQLHDVLPESCVLFPRRLQELGYHTALFGKLHVSGRAVESRTRHPQDGFDIYEWCMEPAADIDSPFNGYTQWLAKEHPDYLRHLRAQGRQRGHDPAEASMNRWAADRAIAYLRTHAGKGPFFCKMSVFDPHNPYQNHPLEMAQQVRADHIPPPVADPEPADGAATPWALQAEREHSYLGPAAALDEQAVRDMRRGYFAAIAHVDREVGRVLAALEATGHAGNTLVLFTSDHGDMLGDHQCLVKGAMLYDPCIRVPLILRGPGFTGGQGVPGLAQLHDLPATVLHSVGAAPDAVAQWMPTARNLGDMAAQPGTEVHPFIVCPYRNSGIDDTGRYWAPPIHSTMVRRGRHKMHLYHAVEGRQAQDIVQLYDLAADPQETADLARQPAFQGTVQRLEEDLRQWQAQAATAAEGARWSP